MCYNGIIEKGVQFRASFFVLDLRERMFQNFCVGVGSGNIISEVIAVTDKQKRFCDEYLIDLNATQAAIRAGYSKKTAYSIGVENLKKPEIKSYIDEQLKKMQDESIAKADEVLKYLTSVMRGESRSQVVIATPLGAERVDKPPEEKDKLKAADMLGKYYALYTEKSKVDADLSFDVHFDYGDDAE